MQSIKNAKNGIELSRRGFLVGTVSSTLMMAFAPSLTGIHSAQAALANKTFSPTVWFEINHQGDILINVAKAEMGQHIGTAVARVLADELGADWEKVSINHVDTDPKWGYMVTGGSWSVFQTFKPMSQAGAAGRIALIEAGAKLMGKSADECKADMGFVVSVNQRISFGDIVSKGTLDRTFTPDEINALPLKPASDRTLIGKSSSALDIPPKTNGTAVYGIDVEVEGMIYARPIVPPTRFGSSVTAVDDSAAKAIPGYLGYEILQDPSDTLQGWVSVLGENYPAAIKAADKVKVSYNPGPTANVSEADILAEGERLSKDPSTGTVFFQEGDIAKTKAGSDTQISAMYRTNTALHFPLEPMNATALFEGGKWHIHTGNQWQGLTLPTLAKALEVPEEQVVMRQHYLGGGFGRRLYGDYAVPAALTSKAIGKPVKLIFTRPDDSKFDQPRSASVQTFEGYFDSQNHMLGMDHTLTAGWPTKMMAPGFMPEGLDKKGKYDPFSTSGADHWYTMANHRARAVNNALADQTFMPGWLRSVGQGWIIWGLESFIDEMAHQAKVDPIEFRLSMLDGAGKQGGKAPESVGGAKRMHNALARLKEKIGTAQPSAKDEGIGIAVSAGQERTMPAWTACAAHVHVNRKSGKVTVKKVTMVMDAGTIVHPDGALAQVEGSILWGVSLALHEHNEFKNGHVANTNLHNYLPLRMNDMPDMDIEFVDSSEFPVGIGEPAVPPVGPAIGNAIYQAVGIRLRDLPMQRKHIKDALA